MLELVKLSPIIELACRQTVSEFMSDCEDIKLSKLDAPKVPEEISGPSIEVSGKKAHYSCLLEYKNEDNTKFIDLLTKKYPFVDNDELPELDILDLLGEFLNILCGKINKELEGLDPDLNIEIPYFVYGLESDDKNKVGSIECLFDDLSFKLHYQV
jgi:hypothetical protein